MSTFPGLVSLIRWFLEKHRFGGARQDCCVTVPRGVHFVQRLQVLLLKE